MADLASIEFRLSWQSPEAQHTDCFFAQKVNLWCDFIPAELLCILQNQAIGDMTDFIPFTADEEIIPTFSTKTIFTLQQSQFNRHFLQGTTIEPQLGRFYPRRVLQAFKGMATESVYPFRCIDFDQETLTVDFNHPLARYPLKLAATVHTTQDGQQERGGRCTDWVETITSNGVGFQARYQSQATDFFSNEAFQRMNEGIDTAFYTRPRLVEHIDTQAQTIITRLYANFFKPGMQVLDLMSSWQSHIPIDLKLDTLIGLGLNAEELARNPQLTQRIVHDLNVNPTLPFDNETFEVVVCTVSVEYLTQPFAVFREVARILKPEGVFIVTFSNLWFPPKTIKIWPQIHEFERMGLVLEYFLESGLYKQLATYSVRNFPRPETDKYFLQGTLSADPVFAVWGQKR